MRLLLVADSPSEVHLTCEGLKAEFGPDTKIEVAQSGEEALERLTLFPSLDEPEVILLNYELPGIDGLEVLQRLRELGDERPVVFITGADKTGLALRALQFGAHDYVTKSNELTANLVGAVLRAHKYARLKADLESAQERVAALEVPHPFGMPTNAELEGRLRTHRVRLDLPLVPLQAALGRD